MILSVLTEPGEQAGRNVDASLDNPRYEARSFPYFLYCDFDPWVPNDQVRLKKKLTSVYNRSKTATPERSPRCSSPTFSVLWAWTDIDGFEHELGDALGTQ